jgi:HSP20 family protein
MSKEIEVRHPWQGLMSSWREMEDRMDRLFEETFGRSWRQTAPQATAWLPAVEVFEKDGKLTVRAELPGLKREDITIEVMDDTLMLSGERKTEHEVKEQDYYRCERAYGSFRRAIGLPAGVDKSQIKAVYTDGVLEVTLPKAKGQEPTKVHIQ